MPFPLRSAVAALALASAATATQPRTPVQAHEPYHVTVWKGLGKASKVRACDLFYSDYEASAILALSRRQGCGRAARKEHDTVMRFLIRKC